MAIGIKNYKHPRYYYIDITEINRAEINKIDIGTCKNPTQTLEKYYEGLETKPEVLVNGGLFYMKDGTPILTYQDEGTLYHEEAWQKDGMGIVGDKELICNTYRSIKNCRDYVSFYPLFIKDGDKVSITYANELNYKTNRTIVGWNKDKLFIINITSPGFNFSQIQDMLLSFKEDIGDQLEYAGNLDGGGSVRKLINGEVRVGLVNNRSIDNVLAVYMKTELDKEENKEENKEEDLYKIGYRVQLGAFSVKSNADNLCAKIKSLGKGVIDYSTAFVKFENNYYRVQVGFFTKKEGAEKVAAELNTKGYETYIRYVKELKS